MNEIATAKAVIDRHGHPVALVKRDQRRPCPCRNELRQEATCDDCFGTGYKVDVKRATAYRKKNAQGSMPDTRKKQDAGAEDVRSYLFYVAGSVSVESGDLLIERVEGQYIVHVISTVDFAQDGEHVVYSAVFTRRRSL